MKKQISILIFSLFFATSAWAISVKNINSYAVNLSLPNGGNVNANREVTISFYTMAKTSKWWVYMDIDGDGLYEDDGEIIAYNENAQITTNNVTTTVVCTIPNTVPVGEYNWAVKVQGTEDHSWTAPYVARNYENDDNRYLFVKALGVAVDCNYNSPFFGYSYVTESYTTNLTGYKTPSDKTYRQASTEGVYMFKYNMGTVWNKDASGKLVNNGAYTGDLQSSIANNTTALSGTTSKWGRDDEINYYKEHSPFRICTGVDDEGYVYVSENVPSADRAQKVFRMDPNNPKASFKVVLTNDDLEGLNIVKRVQSMTVTRTSDGKKVLYAIFSGVDDGKGDGDMGNGVLTYPKLCAFDITDLGDVKCIKGPINLYDFKATNRPDDTQKVLNTFNSIVAGKNDDFWIFQHRAPNANDATAGTLHFNKNWQCDFALYTTSERGNARGVGALSHDGTILAIPTNANVGAENIRFYEVTYDANDASRVVKLEALYNLPKYAEDANEKHILSTLPKGLRSGEQSFIDGMAFDVANNLYFITGSGTGPTTATSRLYVYALPKADNSHVTPARSSLKIRVSEGLTWHPYPDGYNVTNADLLEMFNADRANWNGTLTDFMTSSTSKWKWLGDYIAEITNANAKLPTDVDSEDNEELWVKFKKANSALSSLGTLASIKATSKGRPHNDANNPCGCRIICNNNDLSHAVTTSILSSPDWKWLKDYIKSVQTSLVDNLSDDTNNYWKYAVAAFFLQSQHSSWPTSADFSTAGKPSEWGPAYLAANGGYTPLKTDADWQTQLNNFFNATGVYTTAGQSDQAHNGANGWYNEWWNANFPNAMVNAVAFPTVKRVGYVQNGWYYGGPEGYESAAREMSGAVQHSGHIWARWLEVGLYEGYLSINNSNVTEFSNEEKDIKEVNRNIELINLLTGQEVAIKIDRKLVGGMYNTMCLPFDIAGKDAFSQIVYADGSGSPFAKVGEEYPFSLVKYDRTVAGDDALMLDFVELGDAGTLLANTPFLLMPNTDITKPLKYNAARIIGGGVQPASDEGDNEEGSNITGQNYGMTVGEDDEYFTYTGVLAPTTIPDGSVLLVADNRLAQSTGGEMKGMRGFFTAKIQQLQMPAVVRITSRDGVTTYLDAAYTTNTSKVATKVLYNGKIYILRDGKMYDIMGKSVR